MKHKNFKDKRGEVNTTSEGYSSEIIEYFGWNNCKVLLDSDIILENVRYESFKYGMIKNPYKKSVHSVGFLGVGSYKTSINGKHVKSYTTWRSMLARCYDVIQSTATYKDVTVCEEWHNFQNFAKWFEENYTEGFELDKDIICPSCKVYSPSTCCFVPQEVNKLFTKRNNNRGEFPIGVCDSGFNTFIAQFSFGIGRQKYLGSFSTPEEAFQVYKEAKEQYIKEVADKWKDKINPRVYKAMYIYQVEITD